jgi:mono/diheme cytochrome c family protein
MRTLLLAAALLCGAASSPCAAEKPSSEAEKSPAVKLYERHCSKCHGDSGRAKTLRGRLVGARNLTDAKWQEKVSDEQIREAIRKGPGAMPGFEKKLAPSEQDTLVAFVRTLKHEKTDKPH